MPATIFISSATMAPAPSTITPSMREATTCLGSRRRSWSSTFVANPSTGSSPRSPIPGDPLALTGSPQTLTSTLPRVAIWNLFREQVRIILRHLWGRFGSQVVISETVANGLHIYLFFKRPQVLDRARDAMRNTLQRIQRAYPELERQIDAWNETLRRAGKTWKVRQIGDLEVYPDQKHGFRFIGTRGKVVLADKEIGTVQWGNFTRGQYKGQAKYGFDLVAWWKSIQSGERMPREEVERIIESRLPTQQPALELPAEDLRRSF